MDWTEMLRDSWRIMRRTPALWGLGAISALQLAAYSLIIVGLILPMTALTQVLVAAGSSAATGSGSGQLAALALEIMTWIQRWTPELVLGVVGVIVVWAMLGVLDVAATAGAITQTQAVAEGRGVSVGAGMSDGFRVWWRTIGLLAVAALPTLMYLLVLAVFTLFTISIPVSMGQVPNLLAIRAGDAINSVLSGLVWLVGIPLTVLVNLGLRFLAIEGQQWKAAFSSAWSLARRNLSDVVLMYLLQFGVGLVAALALTLVLGVVAGIAGVVIAVLSAAQSFARSSAFVLVMAAIVAMPILLAYSVAVIVWISIVWTLFWRRLVGREGRMIQQAQAAGGYVAVGQWGTP